MKFVDWLNEEVVHIRWHVLLLSFGFGWALGDVVNGMLS